MSPRGNLPTMVIHGGPDAEQLQLQHQQQQQSRDGSTVGAGGPGEVEMSGSDSSSNGSPFSDPSVCTACQEEGTLVLCEGDGCEQELHFDCADPPLTTDEVEAMSKWFCTKCIYKGEPERQAAEEAAIAAAAAAKGTPSSSSRRRASSIIIHPPAPSGKFGGFGGERRPAGKPRNMVERLLEGSGRLESLQFQLPKSFRERFEGVTTAKDGSYMYVPPTKEVDKRARGHTYITRDYALSIEKRNVDSKGNLITCFRCGIGKHDNKNHMLSCDSCKFYWHMDCLPDPMASPPAVRNGKLRKWTCPLHVEDELMRPLKRVRTLKDAKYKYEDNFLLADPASQKFEVYEGPDGRVHTVPEQGIILRFFDACARAPSRQRLQESRRSIAKMTHDRRSSLVSRSPSLDPRSCSTPNTPSRGGLGGGMGDFGYGNSSGGHRSQSSSARVSDATGASLFDTERYGRDEIEGVFALTELGVGSSPPPQMLHGADEEMMTTTTEKQYAGILSKVVDRIDQQTINILSSESEDERTRLAVLKDLVEKRMAALQG